MTDRDKLPANLLGHLFLPKEHPGTLVARGLDALKKRPDAGPEKLFRDAVDAYERGDFAEAVKWLRKAADQDFPLAQFNLGVMYAQGWGVPQDYAVAANWYRKAADQDFPLAQFNLGVMYDEGRGVPQDYAVADWYRKAADQGYAQAQTSIGSCTPRAGVYRRTMRLP
jgi:TPR repeat protein